jgi:hypothetical protein
MSSRVHDAITTVGNHEIGALNTAWAKHMANGAMAIENFDNYLLVEIGRDFTPTDDDTVLQCKVLTDSTKKGYLATTVEEDHLLQIGDLKEDYRDFYNAAGEMVRITDVDAQKNVRFETSAFSKNVGLSEVKRGYVAHFDPSTKKYIVSDPTSAHSSYSGAANKFEVVDVDTDLGYAFDIPTIRLMSI